MEKLISIYKAILDFCGLEADKEGYISTKLDDHQEPTMVNGKRLVLPLQEQLRSANNTEKQMFHPLNENTLRGESEVITKLKDVINVRLNFTFGVVVQSLLNLVASPEFHKKLDPDQTELMIAVKEADDKLVTNFTKIMVAGVKADATKIFTNIYLKRGGSLNGRRYARVGIVTFPFYMELCKDSDKLFGVKVRPKDKESMKQVMKFIFSGIEEPNFYSFGSDSPTAPNLEALLQSAALIASRFNDIIEQFKDFIDGAEKLVFASDWMEDFENLEGLAPLIRRIPMQAGNEGVVEGATTPELPVATQQPQWTQPTQVQQPQKPPEVKKTKRGLDFNSIVQAQQAPIQQFVPIQQPMQMPMPMQMPWQTGMGMMPMQMQQPYVPSFGMPQQTQWNPMGGFGFPTVRPNTMI